MRQSRRETSRFASPRQHCDRNQCEATDLGGVFEHAKYRIPNDFPALTSQAVVVIGASKAASVRFGVALPKAGTAPARGRIAVMGVVGLRLTLGNHLP